MFEEFEKVRIKSNGVIGTIVDKTIKNGKEIYIVESDTYYNPSQKPYGGDWQLFDCTSDEIEKIIKAA